MLFTRLSHRKLTTQQRVASRNQKVDDDDGHFIVVDGVDLTERCTLNMSSRVPCPHTAFITDIALRPNRETSRPGHFWQGRRGMGQKTSITGCRQDHPFRPKIQRCFAH